MAEGHVCGGIIPRKFLKFETQKYYLLHSEHPKNKKIINNNLSLLSGRKTIKIIRITIRITI